MSEAVPAEKKRTSLPPSELRVTMRRNAGKTPRPLFARAAADARWPLVVEVLLVLIPLGFVIAGLRAP